VGLRSRVSSNYILELNFPLAYSEKWLQDRIKPYLVSGI